MTLPDVLKIVPALLLSACCCCNVDWLIPDSVSDQVGEAVGEAIAEEVLERATGNQVDFDNEQVTLHGSDGEKLTIGKADPELLAKLPILPHPSCEVQAGMTAKDGDQDLLSVAQSECNVPIGGMKAHYRGELRKLSTKVPEIETPEGVLMRTEGRDPIVQVVISHDEDGRSSAVVVVGAPEIGP